MTGCPLSSQLPSQNAHAIDARASSTSTSTHSVCISRLGSTLVCKPDAASAMLMSRQHSSVHMTTAGLAPQIFCNKHPQFCQSTRQLCSMSHNPSAWCFVCRARVEGGLYRTKQGGIDYSHDFFGKAAFLTVSGQLQAEYYATALSNVYTFAPTFRAEGT